MARLNLIRSSVHPYHVRNIVNNWEWFPLSMGEVWKILMDEALYLTFAYRARFHSIVLMADHIHMLITVPKYDLGVLMQRFMGSVTRTLNTKSGRMGRIFASRYRWSLIDTSRYYSNAFKYVYRNPVAAEICERVEDYPYSTLYGSVGNGLLEVPLFHPGEGAGDILIPEDPFAVLQWLNTAYRPEDAAAIRAGLRRSRFSLPKGGARYQEHRIEDPSRFGLIG